MASADIHIHIPKSAITVEVDYDPDGLPLTTEEIADPTKGEHVAVVKAGETEILTLVYTSEVNYSLDYKERYKHNYAHDAEDAADRAATLFGEKLKELMSK